MKRVSVFFLAMLILLCITSCSVDGDKGAETDTTAYKTVLTTSYDYYRSPEDVYEINSKHCTLFFPIKWKDNVKTEIYEDDKIYKVSFYAVFDSESIPLYDFIFGESQEGYLLGNVRTEKGEENVYLSDTSSLYDGEIPESSETLYYEMCEGVNDIISNLVYVNNMTLAG